MLYLIFGIPLYLVTLADLVMDEEMKIQANLNIQAKFCTEGINRFYTECVKLRYQLLFWYRHRRRRVHSSSTDAVPMEYLAVDTRRKRRHTRISSMLVRSEEEMAEFLWKHLEKTHFVEVVLFGKSNF